MSKKPWRNPRFFIVSFLIWDSFSYERDIIFITIDWNHGLFLSKIQSCRKNKDRNSSDYTCKFFKKIGHNLLTILLYHVTITDVNEKYETK